MSYIRETDGRSDPATPEREAVATSRHDPATAAEWLERARASRRRGDHRAALESCDAALGAAPGRPEAQLERAWTLCDLGRLDEAAGVYRAALEQVPRHAMALAGLGRVARRAGDLARALGHFEAALGVQPRAAYPRVALGETLRDLGRLDEAETAFLAVIEVKPDHVGSMVQLAELARRRGDPAAAIAWFEKALALEPANRRLRDALAECSGKANGAPLDQPNGVTALPSRAAGLEPANAAPPAARCQQPDDLGSLLAIAQVAQREQDWAKAAEYLDRCATRFPADGSAPKWRLGQAWALYKIDRLPEAEAAFRSALSVMPDDPSVLDGLARSLMRQGRLAEAVPFWDALVATSAAPLHADLIMMRARCLEQAGRLDEAEAALHAVLEAKPDQVGCMMSLAELARGRGDLAAAVSWFEQVRALDPRQTGLHARLGECLRDLGRLDEAEAAYRRALIDAGDAVPLLLALGEIERRRGDTEAALGWFEKVAAARPDLPIHRLRVGDLLQTLGRFDEAEAVYRLVLEVSPENVAALFGMGLIEKTRHNFGAALSHFQAVARLAPEHRRVRLLMVGVLNGLCRYEEAEAVLAAIPPREGGPDIELELRRFEHHCLLLRFPEALAQFAAWGGHAGLPDGAVINAVRLHASLGRWSDVLDLVEQRVIGAGWPGRHAALCEPIGRAARALRQHRRAIALVDALPDAARSQEMLALRDQLLEELRLVALIDPHAETHEATPGEAIGDAFRAARLARYAEALGRREAGRPDLQIFSCTDGGYLIGTCVSICSLLRHNMESLGRFRITVYCADDALDLAAVALAQIGAAFGVSIEVRPSRSLVPAGNDFRTGWGLFAAGQQLSEAAYYRIYAARRFIEERQADRALYIDSDICVFGGLAALADFDLDGRPLGARLDTAGLATIRRAADLLGVGPDSYFNSGVLLLDLRHPELPGLLDRAVEIAVTQPTRLTFLDQCALNLAFRGRFQPLPGRFNAYLRASDETGVSPADATIIHFLSAPKPWDPMYGSGHCLPWLDEFSAMSRLVDARLLRRLLAPLYPAPAAAEAEPPQAAAPVAGEMRINWRPILAPMLRAVGARLEQAEAPRDLLDLVDAARAEPLALAAISRLVDGLRRASRRDEAEPLLRALAEHVPGSPVGPAGLAGYATIDRRDREALGWWNLALANTKRPQPAWEAARASILARGGQWQEAVEAWDRAIGQAGAEPDRQWVSAWISALFNLGRNDEALAALDSPGGRRLLGQWRTWQRLNCLIALGRIDEARRLADAALAESGDAEELRIVFEQSGRLWEGWPRTRRLLDLLERTRRSAADEDPAMVELRLRVQCALGDREGLTAGLDRIPAEKLGERARALASVAKTWRDPLHPDFTRPKVFGIGLARTGTTSLSDALTTLGLNAAHWLHPVTRQILAREDSHLFDAVIDTPAALAFERDYYRFPNAKFVYTVRPIDDWEHSFTTHLARWWGVQGFAAAEMFRNPNHYFDPAFKDINQTLYFNHASFREAYLAHDRRVRRFFADKPRDRFLELDVFAGDGWAELCRFLDRPVPPTPYPWRNTGLRRKPPAAPVAPSNRPGAEAEIVMSLQTGAKFPFVIDRSRKGPPGFVLGVRKCGTSLLSMLLKQLAKLNNRPMIELSHRFFVGNVREVDWTHDRALREAIHPGHLYGTFRLFPRGLAGFEPFDQAPKLLIVRDPRDALVSEYFSMAYSHPIPEGGAGEGGASGMLRELRLRTQRRDIDSSVILQAPNLLRAFEGFREALEAPGTVLVKYEDYIFRKRELVRLLAEMFNLAVSTAELEEMMGWADQRPAAEDPRAFVRKVTPGDHREKLRPETIAQLDEMLAPAMELYGYR